MRTPLVATRLLREMDELHGYWECCQARLKQEPHPSDEAEMGLIYTGLLLLVPDGLERLFKAMVLDRWDREEAAVVTAQG